MDSAENKLIQVIIIGDECTGKSSLLLRAVDDMFNEVYEATIGIDFKYKVEEASRLKLQIWCPSNQEIFKPVVTKFYSKVQVFAIVFDVTQRETFNNATEKHLKEIDANRDPSQKRQILLVGNKADLPNREVSLAEAEDFAQTHHMMYLDFSSKTGKSDEAFQKFAEAALKSLL